MRTKQDINDGISRLLIDLRTKYGVSKSKMADIVGVDRHTWTRWEDGANVPTIADLVMVYDKLGESILRPILDLLYPTEDIGTEHLRKDAAEYFLESATDHSVRIFNYTMNNNSDIDTQVEAFCAFDHLPSPYKFFLLQHLYVYYQTARQHQELIGTNEVMPDMDIFSSGLKRTQKSAFDKLKR